MPSGVALGTGFGLTHTEIQLSCCIQGLTAAAAFESPCRLNRNRNNTSCHNQARNFGMLRFDETTWQFVCSEAETPLRGAMSNCQPKLKPNLTPLNHKLLHY